MKSIEIKGARVHNLKGIDISIPKNKLVVLTGISGSGKSSLAFDIVFEEGRRQYLKSIGAISGIESEDKFESISGIGPTVAVQQSVVRQSNPRSTVGSKINILNLLGVLYSKEGEAASNNEERLPAGYFSYNNPNGMCIRCAGKGAYYSINLKKLVPDENTTLSQVFEKAGITQGFKMLLDKKYKELMDMSFSSLPEDIKYDAIYGHHTTGNHENRSYCLTRIFQERLKRGENLHGIYTLTVCPECNGYRVGEEIRQFRLNERHIGELGLMTIKELNEFLKNLSRREGFSSYSRNILKELIEKTNSLIEAHLSHLTLYRSIPSLSGGELQRVYLNCHLDSEMDSLIYVLDEPEAGLHEAEKKSIISLLKGLKDAGNTVITVSHDKEVIEAAEHIIDIGPMAGTDGGKVVYEGDINGLRECSESLTGQYLSGIRAVPIREHKEVRRETPRLTVNNAKTNNLKGITAAFPLGVLVGVCGMSGSGKSTLVSDTLVPLLKSHFNCKNSEWSSEEEDYTSAIADEITGASGISGIIEISQESIGRNASSNPASYTGIWDKIRVIFAGQPEALSKGYDAGYFSFNSKGACSVCGGSGYERMWLGGDLDIHNTCKECGGKRFNEDALSVLYNGKNIYDVLQMTVSEAAGFFSEDKSVAGILNIMDRIGMGYIKLGQPTPELSGGEGQRIKLAKELGKRQRKNMLYILDEPSSGLSPYDASKLIELLDELVSKGNSVIVTEHNLDVLRACDWIIELGPGGGDEGGSLIAEGSIKSLKINPNSLIGRYL